jgi:hypothetical protein
MARARVEDAQSCRGHHGQQGDDQRRCSYMMATGTLPGRLGDDAVAKAPTCSISSWRSPRPARRWPQSPCGTAAAVGHAALEGESGNSALPGAGSATRGRPGTRSSHQPAQVQRGRRRPWSSVGQGITDPRLRRRQASTLDSAAGALDDLEQLRGSRCQVVPAHSRGVGPRSCPSGRVVETTRRPHRPRTTSG